MSFWANLTIKAPAVLSGLSGVTGLVATLFPEYTAPLTAATAVIGIFGASLHSLNPTQTADKPTVSSVVVNTAEVVKEVAPVVVPTEAAAAKAALTAEQVEAIAKIIANQG